jgi:uncharacterized membrane protein
MDTESRKAEENAKQIRHFLTSPLRQSATFIGVVGIFVYLVYVLGYPSMFPFPLQNRLLVAILNGAIGYGIVILGAWMAMKAWERKAKRGTKEAKEFLKLNPTIMAELFLATVLVFLFSSYRLSKAFIPGINVVLCIAGTLLIISIVAKDTRILVRDSIKRELLSEQIEELLKRLRFWFIAITLVICVDLIYTFTFKLYSPLSSYPPAVIISKVFLDMGIFMGGITLAIVVGLKLIHEDSVLKGIE